ncbi:hypothetical protein ACIB24_07850 [Spongisporangium articulatum]|uniref:Uncharacterized protein n=1 Tax=Spongisporangium articulatum TaxID=3362603 RepID=A0ABW8AKS3_9ACTN
MIALCPLHAGKADSDHYPEDLLRKWKRDGVGLAQEVSGKFDFMRRDLMWLVGGSLYHRVPVVLQVEDEPWIWETRDEDGYARLNFKTQVGRERPVLQLDDNVWRVPPGAARIDCLPRGRRLRVDFPGGDTFRANFLEAGDPEELMRIVPWLRENWFVKNRGWLESVPFPLTVVEMWERTSNGRISLTKDATNLGGLAMQHNIAADGPVGLTVSQIPAEQIDLSAIAQRGINQWRAATR